MRLSAAVIFLSAVALASAFVSPSATQDSKTTASTSLDARRSMLPIIRRNRPSLLFPDFDRLFDEVDEMMESSLATFPRPMHSLLDRDLPKDLQLRRPLGFDVTQDDKEYKVAVHVPDVEAKDLDLQLDHDGRVLRLKGERNQEDGGMKVQSRFEKAILLSPDVDTSKISANMCGDTLTVVAPKIEAEEALKKAESKKIEIHFEQPMIEESGDTTADTPAAETHLAIKNPKNEKVDTVKKNEVSGEKKWPVKDFPY